MNKKQLLLGDYFQAGKATKSLPSKRSPAQHPPTNIPNPPTSKLQTTITQSYQTICSLISNQDLDIDLNADLHDPIEKIVNMVAVVEFLITQRECGDCQNYQKHLQKLEADVRQHIRLEQQLKLYQDSIEEKNQELKKENKGLEREAENLRKKAEEFKQAHDKISRLEAENEELRNQLKGNKPKKNESIEKPTSSQGQYRKFDSKSNLSEKFPLTRTINFSSNINSAEQRKSIDRKPLQPKNDTDRYRQSLTHKSSNNLRPPTDRRRCEDKSMVREKDKENERRKTKVEFRR